MRYDIIYEKCSKKFGYFSELAAKIILMAFLEYFLMLSVFNFKALSISQSVCW